MECEGGEWTIKLLLMSCRVMTRGVGSVLLSHIMQLAEKNGVSLLAEFVPNDRNRVMDITYRFAGFSEINKKGNIVIMRNELENIPSFPDYIKVLVN